jgi:hypothetical protein
MFKLSLGDFIGIAGIVFAIILVVLDKAGKLKGPILLVLLGVAALMTLPLVLDNSWVGDAPSRMLKFTRGMLLFFVIGVAYSVIAVWISGGPENTATSPREETKAQSPKGLLTLLELFKTDFAGSDRICADIAPRPVTISNLKTGEKKEVPIGVRYCVDYAAKSKFAALYIPASPETYEICAFIAAHLTQYVPIGIEMAIKDLGEQSVSSQAFGFSGRIYIYHEGVLSYKELAGLEEVYAQHKLTPAFRSTDYLQAQILIRKK